MYRLTFFETCKLLWFENIILLNYNKINNTLNNIFNNIRSNDSLIYDSHSIKKLLESYKDIYIYTKNEVYSKHNIDNNDVNSIYNKYFQADFIKETELFYRRLDLINNDEIKSINDFIGKVNSIIDLEITLSFKFLMMSTKSLLQKTCISILIINNFEYILDQLSNKLSLDCNIETKIESCSKIVNFIVYYSFDYYDAFDNDSIIYKAFKKYSQDDFVRTYKEINNKDYKEYCTYFINKYTYYNNLLDSVFLKNNNIRVKLDDVFREYLNKKISKNSLVHIDYLIKFIDNSIKQINKDNIFIDEDINFKTMIMFINYIEDKDYVVINYKRYLAKRLLNKGYNIDTELYVCNKIKEILGNDSVIKIKNMIQDVVVSNNTTENYHDQTNNKKFNTLILTNTMWSLPKSPKEEYPSSLQSEINLFTDFYNKKYNGRKLMWNNNFISGEICFNTKNKRYIFIANLQQINILLKFQYNDTIHKDKIITEYNKNAFEYLIKLKILIENEDILTINLSYKSKKIKQNIDVLSRKLNKKKTSCEKDVNNELQIDRDLLIKSSLVRIMKSKKSCSFNELVTSSVKLINKFSPSISSIKKNIEKLIDAEYIERCEEDKNIYNYLA